MQIRIACTTLLFTSAAVVAQPEVELHYTDQYTLAWWDVGSGADSEGSFWRPSIPPGQGSAFSDIANGAYSAPSGTLVAVPDSAGSPLALPQSFTFIWDDSGTGADLQGAIWQPNAPIGYQCLGMVVTSGAAPAADSVSCLRSDLAVAAAVGDLIWNDVGSGASADFSAWRIDCPQGTIDVGGFIGVASHSQPPGPVYCLDATAVVTPAAPTPAELSSLLSNHGPIVRFHPAELFMPDDPAPTLDDPGTVIVRATVQNESSFANFSETILGATLTTSNTILDDVQDTLSHPLAAAADFRYYLDYSFAALAAGNLGRAKAYVRVQPYRGAFLELQFWIFYPWNGPGKARAVCGILEQDFNPTGPVGRHFSDWENIRVRLTNRNVWNPGVYSLVNVVLSRHSFEEEVAASDSRLTFVLGNPVIYAAKDSHAHYLSAGQHFYSRPASIDLGLCTAAVDLYDLTGDGQELHAYDPGKHLVVSSAWPGVATSAPDWLFFGGRWGEYELLSFCVTAFGADLYCQDEVGNGKPGLIRRGQWAVHCPENANLGSLRTSVGVLTPPFNPNVTAYSLSGVSGLPGLTVTPQAADQNAEVEVSVNGGGFVLLGSGPLLGKASDYLPLMDGVNAIDIRVTVQGCDITPIIRTYALTVDTSPPLFADGFESGNTAMWSSSAL